MDLRKRILCSINALYKEMKKEIKRQKDVTESAADIEGFLFETTSATAVTPANYCNADQKIFSNLPITISCFGVGLFVVVLHLKESW